MRFVLSLSLSLVSGASCAARETYQQFSRLLPIPGPLQTGIETSWIDAPLDANGLINYDDKANEPVGQQSMNYEDNTIPIIYDALASLNQPEEPWNRLGSRPPLKRDKSIQLQKSA